MPRTSQENMVPDLPGEGAADQKVRNCFRFLITEGAEIMLLKIVALPPLSRPAVIMNNQPSKELALPRRSSFPKCLAARDRELSQKECLVCRGIAESMISSPFPEERIWCASVQFCLLHEIPNPEIVQ